ncbi:unnamed protein product, partial [Chrysoparadoxa australica]
MDATLQVLSTGTAYSSPSVMIATSHKRYLFNAGEGTQRLCMEHKLRLAKMGNLFITHLGTEAIAGVPGMILTVADIGRTEVSCLVLLSLTLPPQMTLHGPSGLQHFFQATRHFMNRPGLMLKFVVDDDEHQDKKELTISKVLIKGKAEVSIDAAGNDGDGDSDDCCHNPVSKKSKSSLPPSHHVGPDEFYCYIAAAPRAPGKRLHSSVCKASPMTTPCKFDIAAAKKLGIPRGPDYGVLQKGHAVTLSDGRVIEPHQVLGESPPAAAAAIVHCPAPHLLDELLQHQAWGPFYQPQEQPQPPPQPQDASASQVSQASQLRCVVHFTDSKVVNDPRYLQWCRRFGPDVQHLLIGQGFGEPVNPFQAAALNALRCQTVCEEAFPSTGTSTGTNHCSLFCEEPLILFSFSILIHSPFLCASATLVTGNGNRIESIEDREAQLPDLGGKALAAPHLYKFTISPWKKLGGDASVSLTAQECSSRTKTGLEHTFSLLSLTSTPAASSNFAFFSAFISRVSCSQVLRSAIAAKVDPSPVDAAGRSRIAFLGTGSAQPSKYRNVSGIYVALDDGKKGSGTYEHGKFAVLAVGTDLGIIWMLLDAGEGSMGQLRSLYGEKTDDVLRGIKVIWISHPHADHHLGIMRVLAERNALAQGSKPLDPVLLLMPGRVGQWLDQYAALDNSLRGSYIWVSNQHLEGPNWKVICERIASQRCYVFDSMGVSSFHNIRVIHCAHSYAAIITLASGWKLVYSGDTRLYFLYLHLHLHLQVLQHVLLFLLHDSCTHSYCRPCDDLVEAGKGATVLIHEATFDEGKQDEAVEKRHSTSAEAIDISVKMGAYRTILTHFSQRYPKLPVLSAGDHTSAAGKVCVAFDLMDVAVKDLTWAP